MCLQFVFFLGSTLLAALCTFALRSLPTERVSQTDQFSGFHGAVRKAWLQVSTTPESHQRSLYDHSDFMQDN